MLLVHACQTLLDLVFSLRRPLVVQGPSMTPTLGPGHWLLVKTVKFPWNRLGRGDIVVFHSPTGADSIFVKRVVGLPEEHIQLEEGVVWIDGQPLEEPYLSGPACPGSRYARQWVTGPGEYFLLGDNRSDSQDSRLFGPVSRQQIMGKVWLRCWPFRRWGTVPLGRSPVQ